MESRKSDLEGFADSQDKIVDVKLRVIQRVYKLYEIKAIVNLCVP